MEAQQEQQQEQQPPQLQQPQQAGPEPPQLQQPQQARPEPPPLRPWQARKTETLAELLARASPRLRSSPASVGIAGEVQGDVEEQAEPAQQEYRGPKSRYGVPVSSLAELEAAIMAHWQQTQGDRVPGTDRRESLQVEGLAGECRSRGVGCRGAHAPADPRSPPLSPSSEVALVSRAGREYDDWKLTNQDCALLLPLPSLADLAAAAASGGEAPLHAPQSALLLGVMDGHGLLGTAASRYARQFIASAVLSGEWRQLDGPSAASLGSGASIGSGSSVDLPAGGSGMRPPPGTLAEAAQQLLEGAFERAGAALASSGIELRESGSTAVACLVEPGRVTAAWCGDSRAVVGLHAVRPTGPVCLVHSLTEDHRPDRCAGWCSRRSAHLPWHHGPPPACGIAFALDHLRRAAPGLLSCAAALWSGSASRRQAGRCCSCRVTQKATPRGPSACVAATRTSRRGL